MSAVSQMRRCLEHILINPEFATDPFYREQIKAIAEADCDPYGIALDIARKVSHTGDAIDADPDGTWRGTIGKHLTELLNR